MLHVTKIYYKKVVYNNKTFSRKSEEMTEVATQNELPQNWKSKTTNQLQTNSLIAENLQARI